MRIRNTIVTGLILVVMLIGICTSVYASDTASQVIKVGYFPQSEYYEEDENGKVVSYDSEMLDMVSQYTNITFEYVECADWSDAMNRLTLHEIDLLGTMGWSEERENQYAICDASYSFSIAELAALPDSDFVFQDYEQLNGSTIGYINGDAIYTALEEMQAKNGLDFKTKAYATRTSLDEALQSGEIDLVGADTFAVIPEWKVIEKFEYIPLYFASWEGNEALADTISEALVEIEIYQPGFKETLLTKHFPQMASMPYNKEELAAIEKKEKYTIYLPEELHPLTWYVENEDHVDGIIPDIIAQIEKTTGLTFDIRPEKENTAASDYTVEWNVAQAADSTPDDVNQGKTKSIFDEKMYLYHKIGHEYSSTADKNYKVAVSEKRPGFVSYLQEKYPNYEIVPCDSSDECIEKLEKREVDLAFVNYYVCNAILIKQDIEDIIELPVSEVIFSTSLQFSGENAATLASIVNKGYPLIMDEIVENIIMDEVSMVKPDTNIRYFVRHHTAMFIVIILCLAILVVASVGLVIYVRIIKTKNRQIQAANSARIEFFARMSHDMRTPMNGVLGMAELSEQETDISVLHRNIAMIKESGQYMLNLINDMLDLRKIETDHMELREEAIDPKQFMESIVEMTRETAKQKEIQFVTNVLDEYPNGYVRIDPVRLKQVLNNLLSNAIKFTPKGGTVSLTYRQLSIKEQMEELCLQVSDTGIGMSAEYIKNGLFQAYVQEQGASSDNKQSGTGLGLPIVKNLVEIMGGHIEVQSKFGSGTTFSVYLKLAVVPKTEVAVTQKQRTEEEAKLRESLKGEKILLCEDHPLNAEIARRLLEKAGCIVTLAQNGEEGVQLFEESETGEYGAIIMDVHMPVMDGYEATRRIRTSEHPDSNRIAIIAMTGNANDEDVHQSEAAGMNAYATKPIQPMVLYETIAKFIVDNSQK